MTPALRCDFVIVECINFSYARQVRVIVDREARCKINRMPALSKDDKLRLLRIILESRHADLREQNLNRQGKGHFHVSGMGHEALAAVSIQMEPDDYVVPYYRDRGLVLGRGMTTRQLGLEYFAKRNTGSGGRQMPSHYSNADLHIWSVPTPTGSQLLPACGIAWGLKLDGKNNLVVTTVGDAATRQGDFFEAICFAKEKKLPVLFLVEDNAYGISMPTRKTNPLALDILAQDNWRHVEGQDVQQVYDATAEAFEKIRAGAGPFFFWIKMERLSSHTSSDDQKLYRNAEELRDLGKCDPLTCWKDRCIKESLITREDYAELDKTIKERVRREYADAEKAEDPSPNELLANVTKPPPKVEKEILPAGKYRIGDTVNKALRAGLEEDPRRVLFGEDIEDPKGGVFRLTQKLSSEFPKQVFNSPLAESTILGIACGLAAYGKRPVFELQFIDFIYPGFNQLVTNISTLRWRSFGNWKCPAVIYAPYGAYLPGGSLWHSQANESALAHYPGLSIVIPSTPKDAAGLLWTSMHAEDPVIFLIPKHLLWAEHEYAEPIRAVPLGQACRRTRGSDLTLVAWGNTIEKSLEAIARIEHEMSVELIDLRSIMPWDRDTIEESVQKTRRLVVVQEDTENCSVGQMIISHVTGKPELWNEMISPPILVSKANVMIGYNPIYEYSALPDVERIVAALKRSVAKKQERAVAVEAAVPSGKETRSAPEDTRSYTRIAPALSPTITRKLSHVIPANMQIDARWDAIRKARDAAKKKNGKNAPSPSVMIAWAVVRAMEKHPPFRRLILENDQIIENDNFDLGVAVALEGDRLATAVIVDANKKGWPEFVKIYNATVDATRSGRVDAMNAPIVITSLGAFGGKAGAPTVVPPSVGTLLIGTAHRELIPNGKKNETAEVVTLSLTFDHRVVNGAGAATFVHEIKEQIEDFKVPSGEASTTASAHQR